MAAAEESWRLMVEIAMSKTASQKTHEGISTRRMPKSITMLCECGMLESVMLQNVSPDLRFQNAVTCESNSGACKMCY